MCLIAFAAFLLAVDVKLLFKILNVAMEKVLNKIYCNLASEASFSGVVAVFRAAKETGLEKITRKQVKDWLKKQDVYTLHKPRARRQFPKNRVIVGGKDDQIQADLVDLCSFSKFDDGLIGFLPV